MVGEMGREEGRWWGRRRLVGEMGREEGWWWGLCLTFLPPGEHVSGGGVLVMFRGLEPQLEGDDPRILKTDAQVILLPTRR